MRKIVRRNLESEEGKENKYLLEVDKKICRKMKDINLSFVNI